MNISLSNATLSETLMGDDIAFHRVWTSVGDRDYILHYTNMAMNGQAGDIDLNIGRLLTKIHPNDSDAGTRDQLLTTMASSNVSDALDQAISPDAQLAHGNRFRKSSRPSRKRVKSNLKPLYQYHTL